MTIHATIRNMASSMVRNWRLLGVLGIVVVLVLVEEPRSSVVRTIALSMVATGVALNLLVILANGGRMPAQIDSVPTEQRGDYEVINAETRFACLGDWIEIWKWLVSPGDVFLYTGLAAALADRVVGRYLL